MADTATQQEQNKYAALQSMAAGNSYDAGTDQVKQSQSAALSGLASQAAKINAPQAATDQWSAIASGPYDAALANLAAGHGQQASSNAALDRIWSDYSAAAAHAPVYGKALAGSSGSGAGGGHYGGYSTQGEYENAVTTLAQQAAQQAQADALTASQQARSSFGSEIPAADSQQAQDDLLKQLFQMNDIENAGNQYVAAQHAEAQPVAQHGSYADAARQSPGSSDHWKQVLDNIGGGSAAAVNRDAALLSPDWNPGMNRLAVQLGDQQVQAADPLNLYQFAQEQAINRLGGDPADAMARFSPQWAMGLQTSDLKGATTYATQQQEYAERTANSQAGYGPYTNKELQAMQPTAGEQTQQTMGTPEYQQAAAQAEGLLQQAAAASGSGTPVTSDDLKAMLAQDGYSADVAAAIVAQYGPLFPSASYYGRAPALDQTTTGQ